MQVDINAITYEEIVQFLKYVQAVGDNKSRKLAHDLQQARLKDGCNTTNTIGTDYWYNRFNRLANAIGYDMTVTDVYKLTDDIIYDIGNTRDWILDFKSLVTVDHASTDMGQLVALGQAILGRATQLCPIETGRLRASGKLLVFDDYIIIYFDCPYGVYVHDNLNAHHNIGQAKFLYSAMQQMMPNRQVQVEYVGEDIIWCSISLKRAIKYGHYHYY